MLLIILALAMCWLPINTSTVKTGKASSPYNHTLEIICTMFRVVLSSGDFRGFAVWMIYTPGPAKPTAEIMN